MVYRFDGVSMRWISRFAATIFSCFATTGAGGLAIAQETLVPSYVGSKACAGCHVEEFESWKNSHHAKAWTRTAPENIQGDFNDTTFTINGITSRFYRNGNHYMIQSDGPSGRMVDYPVHSVVGIEPLQQYLLETEVGRIQSFDVVWDTENERWYHLYPNQELYSRDGLHWTGPYKNWNARCAECHATNFKKNYQPQSRTYSSTQAEIGVGCEACHGPGEQHIAWARETEPSPLPQPSVTMSGLTVDLGADGETYIQQCAGCHSRREPFQDGNPIPGTSFHDTYRLSLLRDGSYHADGQILDEVYVYGSFLQSKMYASGVTCGNCHEPHSADIRAAGNGICTQCHSLTGNTDFPTLRLKDYDDAAHHFHRADSKGAECKNCHMIERKYMVLDGRRDHSFRIPRPDLWQSTRAPDACTDCHTNRNPAWAAKAIEKWYPDSDSRGPHFGQIIAAARDDLDSSVENLAALAEYSALPGIARATALEMLHPAATPELATRLAPQLEDPDPLVRAAAIGVQRAAPITEGPLRLVGMLADPVKAVRIAAAREFLSYQIASMPGPMSEKLDSALGEWQHSLLAKTDFPETHMVLGGVGLTTRRMTYALGAFGEAVTLDPQLERAWIMMIRIYVALGDKPAAIETADRAIEANPESIMLSLIRADLH